MASNHTSFGFQIILKNFQNHPMKHSYDVLENVPYEDYDGKRKPFPSVYINDGLSQNILYYSYEKPCTVEELAKFCGVPAYYIEDRISHLTSSYRVFQNLLLYHRSSQAVCHHNLRHNQLCQRQSRIALWCLLCRLYNLRRGLC